MVVDGTVVIILVWGEKGEVFGNDVVYQLETLKYHLVISLL